LKFLDGPETFNSTHDPAVPEGDFDSEDERTLVLEVEFHVLPPIPVIVRGNNSGFHIFISGPNIFIKI
jgi:hypothetical protein